MDFDELEKVGITGGEVFSCCQNREKLKSESNSKLHKFLKGVISLNAEWNEKQKEIFVLVFLFQHLVRCDICRPVVGVNYVSRF